MKHLTFFASFFLISLVNAQYVGINTKEPNATLDVKGTPDDTTKADGIILPRLTLKQLNAKTSYSTEQTGAFIYITDITGGSTVESTAQITSVGRYYFDGENWKSPISESSAVKPEETLSSSTKNTYVFGAGNVNNTGKGNTANGKNSLSSNLNGSNNSAFGGNALRYSESGSDNTALGNNALSNKSASGSSNTALGSRSLYNNAGSRNTGVGKESLVESSGDDNTAIGYNSGQGLLNGSRVISIGAGSGMTGDYSDVISIGNNTKATKNAQVVIGNDNFVETVIYGEIKIGGDFSHTFYRPQKSVQNYWIADASRDDISNMTSNCYGNIGIGYKALENVYDSMMNTAIGFQALQMLEGGADHTAVGAGALQKQKNGVGCTAMGRLAMANSVNATNNTGIGDTALEYNIEGNSNTAVGYSAGIKSGGSNNTLMGVFAGGHIDGKLKPTLSTWNNSNIFGAGAMQANDVSDNNNLFGTMAGHILTGADNSGFGYETLRNGADIARNSAFGNGSGYWLQTGNDNVFIGYNSGRDGQKRDVSGTTVIGANAYSTRSNEIVIGKLTDTHVTIMGVEFSKDELIKLKKLLSEI